jgi:hypothetical protein
VQIRDDEHFEVYLKRFHPIAPEPVPTLRVGPEPRGSLSLGTWLAAVAAILVIGALMLHISSRRVVVPNPLPAVVLAERHAPLEPFTRQSANAWLATAPSFKAAVDDLAFRSQSSHLPQGKQSALAVLSKEKIKL